MKDRREYAMFAVDLPSNPKMAGASALTRWLDVCAVLYAARHFTDGHVHGSSVVAEAGVPRKHLADLIKRGRLHPLGHTCDRCPQPKEDGWLYVHDYLIHQRSAAQAQAQRAAGAKAARVRWDAERNTDRIAKGNARPNARPNAESESEVKASVVEVASKSSLADARAKIDDFTLDTIAARCRGDRVWAEEVVQLVLAGRGDVRDPGRYVLSAIAREPDRYRPTPTPEPYRSSPSFGMPA